MSTPSSTIKICSGVRLNNSYEHTIYFSDLEAQLDYFSAKVVKTFADYTYLRKNWEIKVQATMKQAKTWTYLYFNNGDKNYFYFINNIEYVNDNTVKLIIELDVMQTYMFDYELLKCFVEREHVSDDTIGKHTIDEGLELGEMVINDQYILANIRDYCILIASSVDLTKNETDEDGNITCATLTGFKYDNLFSGLGIYAVDMSDYKALGEYLALLSKTGEIDAILSIWMYPKALVRISDTDGWGSSMLCKTVTGCENLNVEFSRNTKLAGYTPKNKKLLTFPFNFMYATNLQGNSAFFKYERFDDPSVCKFKICGAINPDGSSLMYPLDYNGYTLNPDEGLTLSGYPHCSWNSDTYKLWLAQNQHQLNATMTSNIINMGVSAVTVGGSLATGNLVGVGAGAIGMLQSGQAINNQIAQKRDMSITPPQAKGNHSCSVNFVNGFQTFAVQNKCIDNAHAKMIDDYFSMYGYKKNTLKVPFRNVRENWTYTKTIGCHIKGNLCTEDQIKIESIYNNGVTFWKNGDSIGNYSLSNNIL